MPMPNRLRLTSIAAVLATITVLAGVIALTVPAAESATAPATAPGGWHRVFTDNFTARVPLGRFPSAVRGAWGNSYANGVHDTTGKGTYMPSRVVSYRHGYVNIHLHTAGGTHMVAALLPTIRGAHGPGGGILYGRISFRLRADAVRGYKLGVLLWPDSDTWPADGEIDFPEVDLTSTAWGYVHAMNGTSPTDQFPFATRTRLQPWHVYTITWLPTAITFQVDGRTVGTVHSRIPQTPMHLAIQAETNTNGWSVPNNSSGNVQIDWLTIDTPSCNPALSISPQLAAC